MGTALSGRTAIVTGAGHGAGAAMALALSRAGASVVLAAGDRADLEALVADIESAGGHAVAVPTDLTNPVSVRRLVEQTMGAFGRLDAAVNACADGMSLAMKYQIPPMRRAGDGRIVNLVPATDARDAVIELTRTAALDVADSWVRIYAVAAGPRGGSDQDIAEAVAWLCSAESPRAHGETLYVPNGRPQWTEIRGRPPSSQWAQ